MTLKALLEKKILGDKPLQELRDFLLPRIPPFIAPTNPAAWRRKAQGLRHRALADVYLKGIPAKVVRAKPRVVWGEVLRPDKSYVIRKLRYEAYPDYWIPALLYEPAHLRGPAPVVLNPNGHHRGGKAADYKQIRCANIARRGMIALNIEFVGMSELEADCYHGTIAHLDLTGMAGVGLFYLPLKKGLDVLLNHPHADPRRVCVTGLSGGGWQTIVLAALDERVTLCVPVAGYTAVRARVGCPEDVGDKEQVPADMAATLDFDHMTAMLAPRPALLIYNEFDDCCFRSQRVKPVVYDPVKPTYEAMGASGDFQFYSNFSPGTHNYEADNRRQFYQFVARHFQLDDAAAPAQDIHQPEEIFPEDRLFVGLPAEQRTLMGIARQRADRLARSHRLPRTGAERRALRAKLAKVIRLPRYDVKARVLKQERGAALLSLRTGPWTLPLTVEGGVKGQEPVLVLNDQGRAVPMPMVDGYQGPRYHLELLGHGESQVARGNLILVEATGGRLLGIHVAQVLAAARWMAAREGTRKIRMVGDGWSGCFAQLLAAALEPALFSSMTTYGTLASLRYLTHWPLRYEEAPSLFCFGLLEVADVPQIRALMEGVDYRQPGRCVVADRR